MPSVTGTLGSLAGQRAVVRAAIETLEQRRLLSVSLVEGRLEVRGGSGADAITIDFTNEGNRVAVFDNGKIRRFDRTDIGQIIILGRGGNDAITLNSTVTLGASVYGEAGHDTISGGAARDRIFGGDGHDRINGGVGSDVLRGELGNDVIHGNGGLDTM